ncbi:MAG: hypothetical protein MI976_10735 [Pseudomonadales bacterium]|nr:hypothetical protein [Pseudomonadales bacterium]
MTEENEKDEIKKELEKAMQGGAGPKAARFALAVLGGLIPFAGGAAGGAAGAWSEAESEYFKKILAKWLELQEEEIKEIGLTLYEVMTRLDHNDETIQKRIESPEYLKLVKKCFRDWSAAESEDKRVLIRNLLANAASCKISSDDIVRLFIEWIEKYSEAHFAVIREIYKHEGITRHEIWQNINGTDAREDSPEADLFKLIIHDLSVGHVARQYRETDYYGNFVSQPRKKPRKGAGQSYTSAFDDEKQYVLTELGKQFVHYTMNEIVIRIEHQSKK